jgi:hypothetical protein
VRLLLGVADVDVGAAPVEVASGFEVLRIEPERGVRQDRLVLAVGARAAAVLTLNIATSALKKSTSRRRIRFPPWSVAERGSAVVTSGHAETAPWVLGPDANRGRPALETPVGAVRSSADGWLPGHPRGWAFTLDLRLRV